MTEQRSGLDRRGVGRPQGGRRASDKIYDLRTHHAREVTIAQLVEYWGRHRNTIGGWIRKGHLQARRHLGEYLVLTESAAAWESRDPEWSKREAS